MNLSGKHAVVTGGARGIGLAISKLLATHGAHISILSRSPSPSRNPGHSANDFFRIAADVTDEGAVRRAFTAFRERFGPIAILVNNAGMAESAPLARTPRGLWDRTIATNLTGTFLCTQAVVNDMIGAGWGRIVNIASIAGLVGAPYISAYCASKHGVVGFTRAIAAELTGSGVTANAICPGYTESDMMGRAIDNIVRRTGRSEDETRALLARDNPGGRIATAEEVANAVLDLVNGTETGLAIVVPKVSS
jgi:NAD(P)-dependent dehydrogenase (short-subunit alcohol dehydrogenase family)